MVRDWTSGGASPYENLLSTPPGMKPQYSSQSSNEKCRKMQKSKTLIIDTELRENESIRF